MQLCSNFKATRLAGIGVIARDWWGWSCWCVVHVHSPVSFCCWYGSLGLPKSSPICCFGLQGVIFGGDLTLVISALNQGDAEFASYGNITEDIRCKAANFQSFDFNHVSRSCNCVADALAKKSSKQAGASRVAARATCRHCSFTVIWRSLSLF